MTSREKTVLDTKNMQNLKYLILEIPVGPKHGSEVKRGECVELAKCGVFCRSSLKVGVLSECDNNQFFKSERYPVMIFENIVLTSMQALSHN